MIDLLHRGIVFLLVSKGGESTTREHKDQAECGKNFGG